MVDLSELKPGYDMDQLVWEALGIHRLGASPSYSALTMMAIVGRLRDEGRWHIQMLSCRVVPEAGGEVVARVSLSRFNRPSKTHQPPKFVHFAGAGEDWPEALCRAILETHKAGEELLTTMLTSP